MPLNSKTGLHDLHREYIPKDDSFVYALVARTVGQAERMANPKARAALQAEWDKLRRQGVWDEKRVRPWDEVAAEARREGRTVHVGRIFEICVEKNSELPASDPRRKFKGRVVFQVNNVSDENRQAAMFQELSSAPATIEAAKAADCYALLPGHHGESSDAIGAYTQSLLRSRVVTWVRLPRHQWPTEWEHIRDPVSPLVYALYGHPDSGGHWEIFCEEKVTKKGWKRIPGWRSCFFHPDLRLFLVIYVDDFKLAGPKANLAAGWRLLREELNLEEPSPMNHFLGCTTEEGRAVLASNGINVRTITYNM
jgi:hypothetical protein